MSGQTVKSARRVVEIFEVFAGQRRALTLKDVMDQLGYPASSASSILKSMVTLGYLDFDRGSHTYMPTMRMPDLVGWVGPALFAEGGMLPAMQRLHELTGETVSLGTQSDLYAQYVHVIPSVLPVAYQRPPKTVRSLAGCGLGWLLLSASSDQQIEQIVRRINYGAPAQSVKVQLADLMSQVSQIRFDGYVFSCHTVVRGGGMLGMLVPGRHRGRLMAIGVNGPVERLEAKRALIVSEMRSLLGYADGMHP